MLHRYTSNRHPPFTQKLLDYVRSHMTRHPIPPPQVCDFEQDHVPPAQTVCDITGHVLIVLTA